MDKNPTYEELQLKVKALEKKVAATQPGANGAERCLDGMEPLGVLVGAFIHDINNLFMGIQGNTSLMLLGMDPTDPLYKKLKNIEQYVQNGADLTQRLMGFARRGKYEVKPTDLNTIIKSSTEIFSKAKDDILIHTKYDDDTWTVEVDQAQIERVLLNLYVLAWQTMPDGGELYLQTENVTLGEDWADQYHVEAGGYVKISVTDTGFGLDKETQKKIFDPLLSAKAIDTVTGMGVVASNDIIKLHGGIITVYSEKGEGTTFNIYLPVSEKEFIKEEDFAEELSKGSETVLLVDDEEMIIDVGGQLLDKLGYAVYTAESGQEAIEIYKEHQDDIRIIILDVIMPGMNGGETYDRLKAMDPDVKVLLASGYGLNRQIRAILERGCSGFIQKPFNIKQLSRKVREVLDQK